MGTFQIPLPISLLVFHSLASLLDRYIFLQCMLLLICHAYLVRLSSLISIPIVPATLAVAARGYPAGRTDA